MLLEIYILFQILVLVGIVLTFYSEEIIFSVLTLLFSGFLAIGAFRINYGTHYVYDPVLMANVSETLIASTPYLAYLNMGLFGLALAYLIYDIFRIVQHESKGLGKLDINGGKSEENINYKGMP